MRQRLQTLQKQPGRRQLRKAWRTGRTPRQSSAGEAASDCQSPCGMPHVNSDELAKREFHLLSKRGAMLETLAWTLAITSCCHSFVDARALWTGIQT